MEISGASAIICFSTVKPITAPTASSIRMERRKMRRTVKPAFRFIRLPLGDFIFLKQLILQKFICYPPCNVEEWTESPVDSL